MSLPFELQSSVTHDPHVREIEIVMLRTIDPDHPKGLQSMRFRITIDDQLGQPMNHQHGDLMLHLTEDAEKQLLAIMDWMWDKAEKEIIPPTEAK